MQSQEKGPIGRPRGFDTEKALEQAMRVFWQQGYDGASLTDLTKAMGISRTSMYAAFGSKEDLFHLVLQRYTDGPASYVQRALLEPTAREVATAFLHGAVQATTTPGAPAGCLGVQGSLAAGEPGRAARDTLAAWRESGVTLLAERLKRAADEGDLPAGSDPELLARYLMTVANGIAVQAAGGACRDELHRIADLALLQWPAPAGR
ncbi:TetR/AcrR family transcriptional regulator [Nonomuraea fastidiosa]|uniref:TetR/AcrR family transcriptional regulator n=1 Tax=Nonomuraea TaxID=83681 RepID=UPI00324570BE